MNPAQTQPSVQSPPVQAPPTAPIPVVPISSEPLTLDPNMMTSQTQAQATPVATAAAVASLPKQPGYPVSGPHKERAPIMQAAPLAEYIQPTEVTPQVPQEVAEAGVEVVANPEQPQLTSEHQAVGLQPAREAVPAVITQTQTIQLPYSAVVAQQVEKQSSVKESRHWLAILTEYLLKKLQLIPA